MSEIPRRINSTNISTSRGDDFDNLVLSLASFPPVCIIFCDPLSQIRASEMIFSGSLPDKIMERWLTHDKLLLLPKKRSEPWVTTTADIVA